MLIKTHLAITIFAILLFFQNVNNQIIFIIVALVATFIPDIDSEFSIAGRKFGFLNVFMKHRGFIHSFTFLFLVLWLFILFFPIASLPFFLGYGLHLFADSFTIEGIKPFLPWNKNISWKIKTGGKTETILFISFILLDLFVAIVKFTNFL